MSNTYFQFKQFKIEQDKCAMKVCTDSCMFGAWIDVEENVKTILDIGCGTGLLSLMLAQKSNAKIDAVEIDMHASVQAKQNIENSIFTKQISIYNEDILNFSEQKKYDLIVCNPPFYENEKASATHGEKLAKHSLKLTLENLIQKVKKLLHTNGKFAILLPYFRAMEFENKCNTNLLYIEKKLLLKQTPTHTYFRVCYVVCLQKTNEIQLDTLTIKDENNEYTSSFISLLKPYYLSL